MASLIGQTVSHYKILEKLGEGGMGVVYKAHDPKLDRLVALKFLPHQVTATEEEKNRFLQEARAASAVAHQNICIIYDIQEHEGQQFIVMEYVDGKTLRQLVPIQKTQTAIDYAIQIGEALQEAHSKGIVHRDIKAENIMVSTKNQAKVMDFGLAKLKGSLKLTKTSSTVGTLAYMAPEQIQGQPVDARSDIFSFGVVLYEMLTGHLPFRGEHDAAMMYSILNEEPESLQKPLPDAPSELVHVLDRALEKDPEDRYQTAHEMVIDLRRVKKRTSRVTRLAPPTHPVAASPPESSTELPEKNLKPFRSRGTIWALLAGAVICLAALVLFVIVPKRAVKLNPDMTFRVLPIPFTQTGSPGLSQDGNWAALPAADAKSNWDVYFMNTSSGESRRISLDSSLWINGADISPDGSQIVYDRVDARREHMEIALVSAVGGSSRKIAEGGVFFPRWRPDGQRIGYVRGTLNSQSGKAEIWSIKPDGSDDRCELVDSTSGRARHFSWSPDGLFICWVGDFSEQSNELVVYELLTKKATQVTFDNRKDISDLYWAPNDQIIFGSNKGGNYNLWVVPASGGPATQMTKGAARDYGGMISRDGSKLLYRQLEPVSHIWIAGIDGSNPRQITFDDIDLYGVSFSPDGKTVLFQSQHVGDLKEGSLVCSIDRDGMNRKQLISSEERINYAILSPDGRWIIYGRFSTTEPPDSSKVYLIDARNPATPRLVNRGIPVWWIDDRSFISYDLVARKSFRNSTEGGEPQQFYEDSTLAIPLQGGKYVAYYDTRSGGEAAWISVPQGAKDPNLPSPRRLPSAANFAFERSGRFFYWVKNSGELRRFSIPSGKEEVIQRAFPGLTFSPFSSIDISYDGKEIVYTDARITGRLVVIEHPFE